MAISKLKASSIASGTIDNARIPSLAASKIGSGTFDDARIAASNVSQHATSFDDNKLVNDLSTLGLRVHTQENLNASNSNSASFDVFQDSSAISNLTNCARNSDEFIASMGNFTGASADITSSTTPSSGYNTANETGSGETFPSFLFDTGSTGGKWYINGGSAYSLSFSSGFVIDLNANYNLKGETLSWRSLSTHGRINNHRWVYKDLSGNWQYLNGTGADSSSGTTSSSTELSSANSNTINSIIVNTDQDYLAQEVAILFRTYHNNGNSYCGIDYLIFNAKSYSSLSNATGSFTGNNITASSSTNKMGAVITYQDNAGTNALNTDIILQLSADGGSNYSTATLTALPDFSTGIKMAKVNDLTVTSGTSLKYKISFANQANGSKEARIRGVSLNY